MIRVLIVDDSPFIRMALKRIFSEDGEIQVVGEAVDGKDALDKVRTLQPDVITLDINMPVMDGLQALPLILQACPKCRVLMISAYTKEGARETIKALELGAVDFITKPLRYEELYDFKEQIIDKIKGVAKVGSKPLSKPEAPTRVKKGSPFRTPPVIAIGISTGGPQTLSKVIPKLPGDFPSPILIAIHMPDTFTASFAEHLDKTCPLKVKEAKEGERVVGGTVYISRGRTNMVLRGSRADLRIDYVNDSRAKFIPSADLLMSSVAECVGSNSIGIVMTGMGNDGSKGIVAIKEAGGITVAENPDTAVLWAMPQNAIATGCVDFILDKEEIAPFLVETVMESLPKSL
jgi:two-component system chemotaxis response regulator CheB